MRFLVSDSRDVARRLNSPGCIATCDFIAEFPLAVLGNVFVTVVLGGLSVMGGLPSIGLVACCAFVGWNGFVAYRTLITKRDWVVAVVGEAILVRVFRPVGPYRETGRMGEDVLELPVRETESVQTLVIAILWSSIRRTTVRYLCVEPKRGADGSHEEIKVLESFRSYECDVPKQRLTVCENGRLLLETTHWNPSLEKFLFRMSKEIPSLRIGEPQHVSLDLTGFVSQPESEQRRLLLRMERLGFRQSCVRMLRRRMRMSGAEAIRLMDSL